MPAHARRTVRVTTAPSLEPVTLAEVKSWAKVDSTDDDALLQELLTAARISAEEYTRRSFISQTLRLTLDLSGSGLDSALGEGVYELPHTELYGGLPRVIELPKPPAVSITSVTTYNTSGTSAAYASTNYYLNTHGNRLALYDTAVWPSPLRALGACEVVYVDSGQSGPACHRQPRDESKMLDRAARAAFDLIERADGEDPESVLEQLRVALGLGRRAS